MSYRLQPDEALPDGIRRIAREQLEGALAELNRMNHGREARAVHGTRKHIKKIRAVLRLVCDEIGTEIFGEENQRLRDVGRSLSGARDAEVQLNLLEKLRAQAQQSTSTFRKTAALLKKEMTSVSTDLTAERKAAITTLQWISDRIEGWPLDNLKPEDICCALQRFYRRARKDLRVVEKDPTPENFHSWRKRVKDVWYQSLLLQNLNLEVMCELAEAAKTIGRKLGDLHDVQFLRGRVEGEEKFPEPERVLLLGLLCTREGELSEIALDLGARFFAEKPKAFEDRLLRYARAWRAPESAA